MRVSHRVCLRAYNFSPECTLQSSGRSAHVQKVLLSKVASWCSAAISPVHPDFRVICPYSPIQPPLFLHCSSITDTQATMILARRKQSADPPSTAPERQETRKTWFAYGRIGEQRTDRKNGGTRIKQWMIFNRQALLPLCGYVSGCVVHWPPSGLIRTVNRCALSIQSSTRTGRWHFLYWRCCCVSRIDEPRATGSWNSSGPSVRVIRHHIGWRRFMRYRGRIPMAFRHGRNAALLRLQ
jgi:hypothetical protein